MGSDPICAGAAEGGVSAGNRSKKNQLADAEMGSDPNAATPAEVAPEMGSDPNSAEGEAAV